MYLGLGMFTYLHWKSFFALENFYTILYQNDTLSKVFRKLIKMVKKVLIMSFFVAFAHGTTILFWNKFYFKIKMMQKPLKTWKYLHVHGELASAVFTLVMAAVVVTVAVGVNNARLAQMRAGSEGGEVLAAREAAAGKLRHVSGVRGVWLRGQQERRRRLSSTVLVVKLRAVSSQVEQRVLEGEGVAERGGLLLLLLGQRVGGGSHLAQLVQHQTPRTCWNPRIRPTCALRHAAGLRGLLPSPRAHRSCRGRQSRPGKSWACPP